MFGHYIAGLGLSHVGKCARLSRIATKLANTAQKMISSCSYVCISVCAIVNPLFHGLLHSPSKNTMWYLEVLISTEIMNLFKARKNHPTSLSSQLLCFHNKALEGSYSYNNTSHSAQNSFCRCFHAVSDATSFAIRDVTL